MLNTTYRRTNSDNTADFTEDHVKAIFGSPNDQLLGTTPESHGVPTTTAPFGHSEESNFEPAQSKVPVNPAVDPASQRPSTSPSSTPRTPLLRDTAAINRNFFQRVKDTAIETHKSHPWAVKGLGVASVIWLILYLLGYFLLAPFKASDDVYKKMQGRHPSYKNINEQIAQEKAQIQGVYTIAFFAGVVMLVAILLFLIKNKASVWFGSSNEKDQKIAETSRLAALLGPGLDEKENVDADSNTPLDGVSGVWVDRVEERGIAEELLPESHDFRDSRANPHSYFQPSDIPGREGCSNDKQLEFQPAQTLTL